MKAASRRRVGLCSFSNRGITTFVTAYAIGLLIILAMSRVKQHLHPEWVSFPFGAGSRARRDDITDKYKVILYWNPFFRERDFRFGFGHEPFLDHRCPVHACYATDDKDLLDKADAVLMHGPVVKPPPPKPRAGQRYVYVQGEPHRDLSAEYLPELQHLINLTMTYRRDSDIRLPYGIVDYDSTAASRRRSYVDPMSRRRSVVWVVSHCETPSKREVYVRELRKYIDVDVYGACGKKRCNKRTNNECMEYFEREYRFILAFENDFCVDYASEKLYRALDYDIVPIVYGGANYSVDSPPDSVIEVMDYPNPKNLAKYLKFLTKDRRAYNEYLAWKHAGYSIERGRREIMGRAMCRLCEILHDPDYAYRDYRDLKNWWLSGSCHRQVMNRLEQSWTKK